MELGETEHTIRESLPCSTIIVGREVSSCPLSSSYSTVKIAIFEDLELLQEFQRRTEPERAILARIMYELERIHFACILPTKTNPENGETLNLLGHWFPLRCSSEDLRFKLANTVIYSSIKEQPLVHT